MKSANYKWLSFSGKPYLLKFISEYWSKDLEPEPKFPWLDNINVVPMVNLIISPVQLGFSLEYAYDGGTIYIICCFVLIILPGVSFSRKLHQFHAHWTTFMIHSSCHTVVGKALSLDHFDSYRWTCLKICSHPWFGCLAVSDLPEEYYWFNLSFFTEVLGRNC